MLLLSQLFKSRENLGVGNKLCINCFSPIDPSIGGGEICPHCGYNNKKAQLKGALQYYSVVQDRYILGRVRSANSESFTYSAFDKLQNLVVDIKEFYPVTIVYRDLDTGRVCPAEGKDRIYSDYYEKYGQMARDLVKLKDINSIVPVTDIIWSNNSIYIVFKHFDSIPLRSYVEQTGGVLDWNTVKKLFIPMISSLSAMHALGVNHFNINPETVRYCKDGKLRLFNFSTILVRKQNQGLETDLIDGYAAIEQYDYSYDCSEATDVYGFCATIFFALTGTKPNDAVSRLSNPKLLISKSIIGELPKNAISALANGMQVEPNKRISSFERLKAELLFVPVVMQSVEETNAIKSIPNATKRNSQHKGIPPKLLLFISFIVAAVVLVYVGKYIINNTDFVSKMTSVLEKNTEVSAAQVVTVPNMVGASYNDWKDKLKDTNVYQFTITISSKEFSDDVMEGYIISQDPKAGSTVAVNGVVSIVVSNGSSKRELPVINGLKYTEALSKLEDEGFKVTKEESYSPDVTVGNVMWYRDYNSGDILDYGSEVVVYVSKGPDPATLTPSPSPSVSPAN
jgi:serine/threonine protein kinase